MPASTLYRIGKHFYFNYHHSGSTSSWIHSVAMRRLQFSTRTVICFLAVSFLAYFTKLADHLKLEYLLPIVCILCLQETFGATLCLCYHVTLTLIPLAIFLFLLHSICVSYQCNDAIQRFILSATSFVISYICKQMQTKKFVLLYNVLYFITCMAHKETLETMSFELLGIFLMGMFVTLFISSILFPFFATFDVENRFNYSLLKLQEMHELVIQAFLCHDKISASISLTRASLIESKIREALAPIQTRLDEAHYEPVQYLQKLFNKERRHVIDMSLREREEFITSLMFHICALQLMVKNCSFNDYHQEIINDLDSNILHFTSCQSKFVLNLVSSSSVSDDIFAEQKAKLQDALTTMRSSYVKVRLRRIEHVFEKSTTFFVEDKLAHTFFIFQLGAVVRLLAKISANKNIEQTNSNRRQDVDNALVDFFKLNRPRILSALKSMIIIGVGAMFVRSTDKREQFEYGPWVLVTLCMTQGDTVGGAFTTMKMRLMGTILGSMWAYLTFILVEENPLGILLILSPWIFLFAYLKLYPYWGYTATVAIITPIIINLGELPNKTHPTVDNMTLLRIRASFAGILLAAILTLLIFPVFAIDLLKENIQSTLTLCVQSVNSIHSVYDKIFCHCHSTETSINIVNDENGFETGIDDCRSHFYRLISVQRTFIEHTSLEPTLWWINNGFSTKFYSILAEQETDAYRMLHSINEALKKLACFANVIPHFQLHAAGGNFLPNFHEEFSDLTTQLLTCFEMWISYFACTGTKLPKLSRQCFFSSRKLAENDFKKHEQSLIDLYNKIQYLRDRYQAAIDKLLHYYFDRLSEGEACSTIVPYVHNDDADAIFVAFYAMHHSIVQFAQTALTLGYTVHTIFELETKHLYQSY